jgi:thioredoxin 1
MPLRVNKDNFKTEVLDSDSLVLADFYSDSCIPCKRMSPVLSQLEAETEGLKVVKVNVNFDRDVAEDYSVQSVPTLVFFKQGQEIERSTGAQNKAQLAEKISELIKGE